jgi:putative hydrolase of the HAD superfamily
VGAAGILGVVAYRAVFFDAGETLLAPHPSFPELLSSTLGAEGFEVDPDTVRERVHVVGHLFEEATREGRLWSVSEERSREFWDQVYRKILGELGLPFEDHLAAMLYDTFTDVANYRLFPDVLPALTQLRERGIRLGLISNFEQWLERLLEHLEISAYFDAQVISGIERMEKPDPRIFRLGLRRLEVGPEVSAHVGDSVPYDVVPSSALGMTAILLDRRDRYPEYAETRITTLNSLPGALGL